VLHGTWIQTSMCTPTQGKLGYITCINVAVDTHSGTISSNVGQLLYVLLLSFYKMTHSLKQTQMRSYLIDVPIKKWHISNSETETIPPSTRVDQTSMTQKPCFSQIGHYNMHCVRCNPQVQWEMQQLYNGVSRVCIYI